MRTWLVALMLVPLLSGCLDDEVPQEPLDEADAVTVVEANATFERRVVADETFTVTPADSPAQVAFDVPEGAKRLGLEFTASNLVGQWKIVLVDPAGKEYLFHDVVSVIVLGTGAGLFSTNVVDSAHALPGAWTLSVDVQGAATDLNVVVTAK